MIRLPRLLDRDLSEIARVTPARLSITQSAVPLSTAEMLLPPGDPVPETGQFAELFTPVGSVGIFRIRQTSMDESGCIRLTLEHGLCTLADCVLPILQDEPVVTPAREVLEQILSCQSTWQLGQCQIPADASLAWSGAYPNALRALTDLLDALPGLMLTFDQSSQPWTLHVVRPAADPCEFRLNRNLDSLRVETDRSALCTRLHLLPADGGDPVTLDAATQDRWGVITRTLAGTDGLTADELRAQGEAYLARHCQPALTITLSGRDLSAATGEDIDRFVPGKLCRVCLPHLGLTLSQQITRLTWDDLCAHPDQVTITLADAVSSASDMLGGLVVDATVIRRRVVETLHRLREQQNLLLHAQESITMISREIDLLAEQITLKADLILLDGYVKADQLETDVLNVIGSARLPYVDVTGLYTDGDVNAAAIAAGECDISDARVTNLSIGGQTAATQSWVTGTALTPYATQASCMSKFVTRE